MKPFLAMLVLLSIQAANAGETPIYTQIAPDRPNEVSGVAANKLLDLIIERLGAYTDGKKSNTFDCQNQRNDGEGVSTFLRLLGGARYEFQERVVTYQKSQRMTRVKYTDRDGTRIKLVVRATNDNLQIEEFTYFQLARQYEKLRGDPITESWSVKNVWQPIDTCERRSWLTLKLRAL